MKADGQQAVSGRIAATARAHVQEDCKPGCRHLKGYADPVRSPRMPHAACGRPLAHNHGGITLPGCNDTEHLRVSCGHSHTRIVQDVEVHSLQLATGCTNARSSIWASPPAPPPHESSSPPLPPSRPAAGAKLAAGAALTGGPLPLCLRSLGISCSMAAAALASRGPAESGSSMLSRLPRPMLGIAAHEVVRAQRPRRRCHHAALRGRRQLK